LIPFYFFFWCYIKTLFTFHNFPPLCQNFRQNRNCCFYSCTLYTRNKPEYRYGLRQTTSCAVVKHL
jgi:hypothetical protein